MHPHAKGFHTHTRGPSGPPRMTIDETTPQPYRTFYALREVMRSQKQLMMRRLSENGAHMGQALTLWVLSENEGLNQAELAELLNVARPTVTVMLKKMERAGLVERRADEHDSRSMRIHLTDAGRAMHARLREVHEAIVHDTMAPLSEADQIELERLLLAVQHNIDDAAQRDAGTETPTL